MSEEKHKDNPKSFFTPEQGSALIRLARQVITGRLRPDRATDGFAETPLDDDAFRARRGTFVTLTRQGKLRGCIGCIGSSQDIFSGVRDNALGAAFSDSRFNPLTDGELDDIAIEVTILTDAEELDYKGADDLLARLRPRVDGVIIRKGSLGATFLPQVWDQLPDPEVFLSHLCRKAGLSTDAWKKEDLVVMTYQVQYFEEK